MTEIEGARVSIDSAKLVLARVESGLRVKLCFEGNSAYCRSCAAGKCRPVPLGQIVSLWRSGADARVGLLDEKRPWKFDLAHSTFTKKNALGSDLSHGAVIVFFYWAGYSLAVAGPSFKTNAWVFPESAAAAPEPEPLLILEPPLVQVAVPPKQICVVHAGKLWLVSAGGERVAPGGHT